MSYEGSTEPTCPLLPERNFPGAQVSNTPSDVATRKPERPHEAESAMALADRIDTTPPRISGKPCSVGLLLAELPTDEADALTDMLHTLGWSASRIYEALAAEGHEVGRQTINRHRSRACRCFVGAGS